MSSQADNNSAAIISKQSSTVLFNGKHEQYTHESRANNCVMKFAIYLPPQASDLNKVPVIYWLSGLTCTDENFMQKAGAQKMAAQLGIAIVCPDTSPRGEGVPDDPEGAYDFGLGAGFYINATQSPWNKHYQMYTYIMHELIPAIEANFPVSEKRAISGHSMGGHGALTIGLKNTEKFTSVSAFSPICNPSACPWGQKAFSHYLGEDRSVWQNNDACYLLPAAKRQIPILIDQGSADNFLAEQLKPEALMKVAIQHDYNITFNMHTGYDHSYYFIASFIDEHIAFHAQFLNPAQSA